MCTVTISFVHVNWHCRIHACALSLLALYMQIGTVGSIYAHCHCWFCACKLALSGPCMQTATIGFVRAKISTTGFVHANCHYWLCACKLSLSNLCLQISLLASRMRTVIIGCLCRLYRRLCLLLNISCGFVDCHYRSCFVL